MEQASVVYPEANHPVVDHNAADGFINPSMIPAMRELPTGVPLDPKRLMPPAEPSAFRLALALFRRGQRHKILGDRWFLVFAFSAIAGMYAWLVGNEAFNATAPMWIVALPGLLAPYAPPFLVLGMWSHTVASGQFDELRLTRWSERTIIRAHGAAATMRIAALILPFAGFPLAMALLQQCFAYEDRWLYGQHLFEWTLVGACASATWFLACQSNALHAMRGGKRALEPTARRLLPALAAIAATQLAAYVVSMLCVAAFAAFLPRSYASSRYVDAAWLWPAVAGGVVAWVAALPLYRAIVGLGAARGARGLAREASASRERAKSRRGDAPGGDEHSDPRLYFAGFTSESREEFVANRTALRGESSGG